jgi:hypothetical protein
VRTILAALGFLAIAAGASADGRSFHLSAMGGVSISKYQNVQSPFNADFQRMKGISAGLGVSWPVSTTLAIQPELTYIEKGISYGKVEDRSFQGIFLGSHETLLVQRNLEIPVLLRWGIPVGGPVHPALEAGPFVSFELAERLKTTGEYTDSRPTQLVESTDYGVVLGAALGLDVGAAQWMFEGRYEPGLAELGNIFGGPDEAHSDAFVISTGVRY